MVTMTNHVAKEDRQQYCKKRSKRDFFMVKSFIIIFKKGFFENFPDIEMKAVKTNTVINYTFQKVDLTRMHRFF